LNAAAALIIRPIAYREPRAAFAPLAGKPWSALLDGADNPQARFAYIAVDPFDVLRVDTAAADPFAGLREKLAAYKVTHDGTVLPAPFIGGALGFVGYEVAHALEQLPPRKAKTWPCDLAFGFYDAVAVFDLKLRKAWIISSGFPETDETKRKARALDRAQALEKRLGTDLAGIPPPIGGTWSAELSAAAYRRKAEKIIDYIRAGDIFQANLTQRWTAPWPANAEVFDLYRRLLSLSAAPFAAYLCLDETTQILSASPERFLSVDHRGFVETRPIKGTRPRGTTPEQDLALAAELRASPKDRAENLMIVDLLRNDLSRVCRAGSVEVPTLCGLETFPTVHHLVSVVTGQLRPECCAVDLLAACFPGGSITGAPKIRAMEIIHEFEPSARGPYCGTVAWFGFDGAMDSSIVIRTLTRNGGILTAQAGGGVVADSEPAQEYAESVLKAQPMLAALTGDGRFACASA